MKQRMAVMFVLLGLVVAAPAIAADGMYLKGSLGVVMLGDSDLSGAGTDGLTLTFDPGLGLGAAVGFKQGALRFDGEVAYRMSDIDQFEAFGGGVSADGEVNALSLLANCYFDIPTGSVVTPFVGAGIGGARVSGDASIPGFGTAFDDDDVVFAWQLAAGVGIQLTPTLDLDLEYRYFATADPDFTDVDGASFSAEYGSHNLMIGLRTSF